MAKVEQEQAKALQRRHSRWQCMKKWLWHHKIETTAVLVCVFSAAAILAIVYVGRSSSSPSSTPISNTPPQDNIGNDDSTSGSGADSTPSDDMFGTPETEGDNGDSPPPAPDADTVEGSPIFQELSLLTDLQDTTSPQYKAADWLIAFDFLKVSTSSPNLHQRFALATFYMATGGGLAATKEGWTRCSAVPPPVENVDTEAASNIQCVVRNGKVICAEQGNFETCEFSDEYDTALQGKRFLSAVSECEWFGITCDTNGVVNKIDIESNELGGYLPPEMALLTGLTRLNLFNNTIGGSIPEDLSLIEGLSELLLTSNKLEGKIPVDIYDLQQLMRLEVEHNNLEGPLLPAVGNLKLLQIMYANHNKLTGELPSELGNLVNLRKATFNQNLFTGLVPSDLGNLVNLESIKFAQNSLTGTIPSNLCDINVRDISADCLFNTNTNITEVTCSCCTRCCADGQKCQDN